MAGRPKGRNFKARSIMLSDEQVAYLERRVALSNHRLGVTPLRGISEALRQILDAAEEADILDRIMHAESLEDLRDALNEDLEAASEDISSSENSRAVQDLMSELPTFGEQGELDTYMTGIWSWDDEHVLRFADGYTETTDHHGRRVGPGEWYLDERPNGDE